MTADTSPGQATSDAPIGTYLGTVDDLEVLVDIYSDGTACLVTRPRLHGAFDSRWSAPHCLKRLPIAEVVS